MAFVDLEKPFNLVSRQAIWWDLNKLGFEEWLVVLIAQNMHKNASSRMIVGCNLSEEFSVKVFSKALV